MTVTVLVVVVHSDDKSISMAGTIRKHFEKRVKVHVVSMTNSIGVWTVVDEDELLKSKVVANQAGKILGFEWSKCFDFCDNKLDLYPLLEVVRAVEKAKKKYKPKLVYAHSAVDLNIDHTS